MKNNINLKLKNILNFSFTDFKIINLIQGAILLAIATIFSLPFAEFFILPQVPHFKFGLSDAIMLFSLLLVGFWPALLIGILKEWLKFLIEGGEGNIVGHFASTMNSIFLLLSFTLIFYLLEMIIFKSSRFINFQKFLYLIILIIIPSIIVGFLMIINEPWILASYVIVFTQLYIWTWLFITIILYTCISIIIFIIFWFIFSKTKYIKLKCFLLYKNIKKINVN